MFALWGPFGAPMGVDWGALGALRGSTGVLWGPCGGRPGCSGAPMGVDWGALGPLRGSTGVLWGLYGGSFWDHLFDF